MRRAMRHAHLLGAEEPLMWRLAPTLIEQMGTAYPELQRAGALPLGNAMLKADAALQTEYQERLAPGAGALHEAPNGRIFVADIPALEISSTDIRRRCADGKSPRYLVADAVANYINTNSLYRTC